MTSSKKNGVSGLPQGAEAAGQPLPETPPHDSSGQETIAYAAKRAVPELSPNDGKGRGASADEAVATLPDPSPIDRLAELQVRRKFYISVANKQTNAAKALVRRALGYSAGDEEESRAKHAARATRIVTAALAGRPQKVEDAAIGEALAFDLSVIADGLKPFADARHGIELAMERIARKLPVHEWQKGIVGFGERALAVIIGEAGNLSGYPKKGHLWKRLGLAPFEGKALSTWRREGGLTAEDWTEAGYSPRRRAEIYALVSEPLFKHQTARQGPYRAVYDRRRALTALTHPDWTPIHSHMDGLRIMTKALIRDLWREWNRREAKSPMPPEAIQPVPTGEPNEREAKQHVPPKASFHLPPARPSTDHREAVVVMPLKAMRCVPLGDLRSAAGGI